MINYYLSIPKHLHQEIVTDYNQGLTMDNLANKYNTNIFYIHGLLHHYNVKVRATGNVLDQNAKERRLQMMYDGLTDTQIARIEKTSRQCINAYLKKYRLQKIN